MKHHKELDPFKETVRGKLSDQPDFSDNNNELWEKVLSQINPEEKTIERTAYTWYAIAASILLFICGGLGVVFLNQDNGPHLATQTPKKDVPALNPVKEEVTPQSSEVKSEKATPSADKEISRPGNSRPTSSPDFVNPVSIETNQNIVSYPLADGSLITINEDSKVKVSKSYLSQRNVMIEGEAYFEVEPNKHNPFTIYFGDAKLVVVGTKFNVRNIMTEGFKEIAVTEGVVRVFPKNSTVGIEVKAGHKLTFSSSEDANLVPVEVMNYISWKTGTFDFKSTKIEEVAHLLSRKYKKEIIVSDQIKSCKFTGDLDDVTLTDALQIVSLSTSLKVEKSNDKLYLTGSACD